MPPQLPLPLLALPLLAGCDAVRLGVMNAAGPVAETQRHLYLILAIVLVFVAGPVLLLTPLFAWHYRLSNKRNAYRPEMGLLLAARGLIWIPPTGIVIGLGVLLWTYTHRLDPYRPIARSRPPLEIQAVALDWKWLFIYPDQRVATVNQLAIPVGRPVRISLTSGTVMQSLLDPAARRADLCDGGHEDRAKPRRRHARASTAARTRSITARASRRQKFDVVALSPGRLSRAGSRACSAARDPLDAAAYAAAVRTDRSSPKPVSIRRARRTVRHDPRAASSSRATAIRR